MTKWLPLLGLLAGCAGGASTSLAAAPLRVMSFNVRYGTAKDEANHWDLRKDLCAGRPVAFQPDLLGLQEALHFQNAHLKAALGDDYGQIGVAREDGKDKGEFTTILYRRSRLELRESGTFWLSLTPDVAGSKSWDSLLPRIATWARFGDRAVGGRELLMVNTHFDHKGMQARLEAARLLKAFVEKEGRGGPVIVTGDFNAGPGSDPYRALVEKGRLADTWRELHAETHGTAHPFTGTPVTPRIDWILCSPHFEVKEAAIDLHHEGSRWPSDHFPVAAVLLLTK
jgi:endonuclease/exonuclease/phosphatase family metal-dependent hydrolase